MAGITAASATTTLGSGSTAADKIITGYVTAESIALATYPTGSAYSWGIAKPSGATARSDLSSSTDAAPSFTPDVPGIYVVTCTVDSTTAYILRVTVTQVAAVTAYEAVRLTPKADADIPTPPVGVALYYSSTQSALAIKDSAGAVSTVNITAV